MWSDSWTVLLGSQQLTRRQKEWLMGRALKYAYGWLTSVGRGWPKKEIYNARDLPQRGGVSMALLGSQTRLEFSPSDREVVQHCVLSSYSIILNARTNNCPVKAQLLSSVFTKFIVMGLLGLDPTHPWAQSENCDPTIGAVCGKLLVR